MIKCTIGQRGQRMHFSGVYGHRLCLLVQYNYRIGGIRKGLNPARQSGTLDKKRDEIANRAC